MPAAAQLLAELRAALSRAGVREAEAEAREILFVKCGFTPGDIALRRDEPVSLDYAPMVEQRAQGMPLAYILGEKHFYGRRFFVDNRVLIPRYDTEVLVEAALWMLRRFSAPRVLDLCCGSGCIGLTIKLEQPEAQVTLADISCGCLEVARKNAGALGAQAAFVQSNLFEVMEGTFDLIVCNPPYVERDEYLTLDIGVREYEPRLALTGGLTFYPRIAAGAHRFLRKGGGLALEVGWRQAKAVADIVSRHSFTGIEIKKDLQNIGRVVTCWKS